MVSPILQMRKLLLLHCGIFLEGEQVQLVPSALPLLMDLILVSLPKCRFTHLSDIENNRPQFYPEFISALRKLYATDSKKYYISGAPQFTPCKNISNI